MVRTSRRPVGSVVPAMFDGYCRACRRDYLKGTPIRKAAQKVWVHEHCPDPTDTPPAEPPAITPPPAPTISAVADGVDVRAIVRDELSAATLAVDEAEVKAMVAGEMSATVDRVSAIADAAQITLDGAGATCERAKAAVADVYREITAQVSAIVTKTKDEMLAAGLIKQVVSIEVKTPTAVHVIEGDEPPRPGFDWMVQLAAARKNILLIGPAGCGKTYVAKKLAAATP